MFKGVGVDLCAISRMEKMLDHAHFMERCFTPGEREYIASKGKQAAHTAAGIFAAKQAYLKAIGTGIDRSLQAVEITHAPLGQPCYGNDEKALLSISHDGDMAIAFCMVQE